MGTDQNSGEIMKARPLIAAATIALMVGVSAPAFAVTKSGTLSCPGQVRIDSYSTGTTQHFAPSTTVIATYSNGSSAIRRSTLTGRASTGWKVAAVEIIQSGTGAACTGI